MVWRVKPLPMMPASQIRALVHALAALLLLQLPASVPMKAVEDKMAQVPGPCHPCGTTGRVTGPWLQSGSALAIMAT